MIRSGLHYAAPFALALALSACGGGADEAETAEVAPEPAATPTASDPLEREYELTEEQQERRDGFDEAAFREEYTGFRDEIMSDLESGELTALPSRDDMDWSFMDRDEDGGLSLAEYAIWGLPIETETGGAPEITSEDAGTLADSFYHYDIDGDSEISQREFTVARSGDMIS